MDKADYFVSTMIAVVLILAGLAAFDMFLADTNNITNEYTSNQTEIDMLQTQTDIEQTKIMRELLNEIELNRDAINELYKNDAAIKKYLQNMTEAKP